MLSAIMLSAIMLIVTFFRYYAECRNDICLCAEYPYAECSYAECLYAKCRCAECRGPL
jgi:hypothetical protein